MHKLSYILIALGFLWICLWSTIGTLLGAYLFNNQNLLEEILFQDISYRLIKSAHAHMNTMGITLIVFGLTAKMLNPILNFKSIQIASYTKCFSIVLFGLGLILRGLFKESCHDLASILTALGATGYILVLLLWSACLFLAAFQKGGKKENGKEV